MNDFRYTLNGHHLYGIDRYRCSLYHITPTPRGGIEQLIDYFNMQSGIEIVEVSYFGIWVSDLVIKKIDLPILILNQH